MKKVGNHTSFSRILLFCLALSLSFSLTSFAQETAAPAAAEAPAGGAAAPAAGAGDPVKGKELFNSLCAACHKLDAKSTGPALRGVADRHDRAWIYKWVHNSSEMIKSGDPAAVKLFAENNNSVMTPFPQLSEGDIDNIMAYTSMPIENGGGGGGVKAPVVDPNANGGSSNALILGALILVLGVLIVMLVLVNRTLRRVAASNGVVIVDEPRLSLWKAYAKNQFLVLVTVILLMLASSYFLYGYLMQIGVDQGYEPVQPIHFSHKIHAGDNGIDCKYCHSSARVSKASGIPSLNVCMNCHKNIAEFQGDKDSLYVDHSKEFYTGEIKKLYNAVGWDATAQKYTGVQKPVKWVRIHNLPDFVYFNHSQHVTVAGVECQTCHGPVEKMEVMRQHSPLTMGWCINCHRTTDVKVEGNEYYAKIHDELAKKYGKDKLTAADMGGTECGKCHY
ncbi:cytochrome C [Flavobacterium album]|uniref:Cytochrome C n=1 Tax=Flavobacterium album TaxID=2175091 RepID=A0A2S1QUE4_9FLAO|nr:cytochrome c3 family protein [Flavobacterium album]AWH83986.1 cytochrome C [Flavobacterium album]